MEDQIDDADHSARVRGQHYLSFLANLHAKLRPETYFEIGTSTGSSLLLAQCASIAVDPQFRLTADVLGSKPSCAFYQMGSDLFFRRKNLSELFGQPVDLAFLDGMHLFEFLLRDFANTERHCRRNSVVVLHDCLPPGFFMTARSPTDPIMKRSAFASAWTGDVWKVVPALRRFRPNLSITVTDCAPTGLVLLTNLDPSDTTIMDGYGDIVADCSRAAVDRAEFDDYWSGVEVVPSAELLTLPDLGTRFWL